MLPNEALLPSVFKVLFNKFGWKKLYTIAEDSKLFTAVSCSLNNSKVCADMILMCVPLYR